MQRTWGMEVAEVALDILRCAGRVLPSVKKQKRHFALPNGNLPQQVIAWSTAHFVAPGSLSMEF